jgi:predicted O-linked N-acetylglucosamine transferase (SPINDLY family)
VPRRELRPRNLDSKRRIVVGYVSSDFRDHSASLTFKPLLRHHDQANFEVVCYSCAPVQDAVTEECRSLADRWVDARQLSDRELADRIESDGVDILVDLSGHTDGNRLGVFAAKPAPIQVTAWGHVTGTGLPTIDYLFADKVQIPEGVRHLFAERVYDLPCLITMEPPRQPLSSALPMIANGHVTFGVFNRIDKISDGALALWSRLLQAVPGSVIMVKHSALSDAFVRDNLIGRFVAHGVAADRVCCLGGTTRAEHLAAFADVDISLDPFPQNGGVSTWESLHMGVPVVARLGSGCSSRAGGAIVKAVGLDDWVADDDEGYLAIAREHASRPVDLAALRARLPAMLAGSEAGNTERYVRRVEEGYRRFWRDLCASHGS